MKANFWNLVAVITASLLCTTLAQADSNIQVSFFGQPIVDQTTYQTPQGDVVTIDRVAGTATINNQKAQLVVVQSPPPQYGYAGGYSNGDYRPWGDRPVIRSTSVSTSSVRHEVNSRRLNNGHVRQTDDVYYYNQTHYDGRSNTALGHSVKGARQTYEWRNGGYFLRTENGRETVSEWNTNRHPYGTVTRTYYGGGSVGGNWRIGSGMTQDDFEPWQIRRMRKRGY